MSKTDAMRAMKQARAEAAAATRPAVAVRRAPVAPTAPAAATPAGLDDLAPEPLCGHTAIGGKRCTRPQGHPEKNHRYAA